jgi:RNA polymerase sigma-B factor
VRYAATAPESADPPHSPTRVSRKTETSRLLDEAHAASGDHRTELQDAVIALNMPVALDIARRYFDRGIANADLEQVAYLGLTKAARSFDPTQGHDFLSFAVPTVRGELRRHFRDVGWMVRPPRRVQELQPRITRAEAEMCQSLGRSPRPSEIAEYLDVPLEDITEALAANGCFAPASLDAPAGDDDQPRPVDRLGGPDAAFSGAEARAALRPLLKGLSDRERLILELRFCHGLTQREIGEQVGVTQMQISRVLAQVLARLRSRLVADSAA